jgi:hypothetical protein
MTCGSVEKPEASELSKNQFRGVAIGFGKFGALAVATVVAVSVHFDLTWWAIIALAATPRLPGDS